MKCEPLSTPLLAELRDTWSGHTELGRGFFGGMPLGKKMNYLLISPGQSCQELGKGQTKAGLVGNRRLGVVHDRFLPVVSRIGPKAV